MYVTHRVKNSDGETVGFMLNNEFINNKTTLQLIKANELDNLSYYKNGYEVVFRANKKLPVISYKEAVINPLLEEILSENPIIRDIQNDLNSWRLQKTRKVLRIDGPRQIGKTTEIKKFAYSNYEVVIYVNLVYDKYKFSELISSKKVTPNLMNYYCEIAELPKYLNSNKTILIIDEIQVNTEVYNQIRDLSSGLKCDIVVTGSYLGKILNKSYFHSMGTVSPIRMFPLSFGEFVNIFDKRNKLQTLSIVGKSDKSLYDSFLELYNLYRNIGGYPSVVSVYMETHNINKVYEEIKNLLNIFKEESNAYFDDLRQVNIFNEVYRSLLVKITFEKKGVDSGKNMILDLSEFINKNSKNIISRDEVNSAINWIIRSGILNGCDLYQNGDYINVISMRRLYFIDCGLTSYLGKLYGIETSNLNGLITETFVFNELLRKYSNNINLL